MQERYCILCGKEIDGDDPTAIYCSTCFSLIIGEIPTPKQQTPKKTNFETNGNTELTPGQTLLGTYQVVGKLGEGGMGKVYRVHHTGWNMDLAVKQPKPEIFKRQTGKENFIHEAETWVDLGLHPHITSCYYVRTIDQIPNIFVEFMAGGSLEDWIQRRQGHDLYAGTKGEALGRILDIAIQFAWGLDYAHQQGLVHQDVKPLNVLMTPEGITKVTDFGLATARAKAGENLEDSTSRELRRNNICTIQYRSPEQANGDSLDHKTDIWSWAVSILEMFTGGVFWMDGSAAETSLDSYLQNPGEETIPAMPEGLVDMLRVCFQKTPADRPKDMKNITESLIRIYQEEIGENYPRKKPKAVELRADSLNNKALSMLDLGNHDQAVKIWRDALQIDPTHLEANYNLGYWEWAHTKTDDMRFLQRLNELETTHRDRNNYWLGLSQFHRERGALKESERCREKADIPASARTLLKAGSNIQPQHTVNAPMGLLCVRLSPDNRLVLVGGLDKKIHLIELATKKIIRTYIAEQNSGEIFSIGVTPKWDRVVCGSGYATLQAWEVDSGRLIGTIQDEDVSSSSASLVTALEFTSDGRFLISAWKDHPAIEGARDICLWDIRSGKLVDSLNSQYKSVYCLALSPGGQLLAASGWRNGEMVLTLWDMESRSHIADLEGHQGLAYSLAISPDERFMLSGSQDGSIELWDLRRKHLIRKFYGHHSTVRCVAFHPDGQFALSGSEDCTLRFWDLQSGRCLRTLADNSDSVYSASFSTDGSLAVSASKDGSIRSYSTHLEVQRCCDYQVSLPSNVEKNLAQQDQLSEILKEADSHLQAGRSENAYTILRKAQKVQGFEKSKKVLDQLQQVGLDAQRSGLHDVWLSFTLAGHSDAINGLVLTNNDRTAISASSDLSIRFWDLEKRICTDIHTEHRQPPSMVILTPDGKYLISASKGYGSFDKDADQYLRLWQMNGWQLLHDFQSFNSSVNAAAFSPTTQKIFIGRAEIMLNKENDFIQALDIRTGERLQTLEGHNDVVTCMAVYGEGKYLLSGSRDTTLKVWEANSGNCLNTLHGHQGGIFSLAVLSNGRYALSGGVDNTLRLWDLNSGICIKELDGHTDTIHSIAVTSDGHFALSGGDDRVLRLWDLQTGNMLEELEGHTDSVNAIVFSHDGRYALSGGFDKEIKVWEFDWEYSW